MSAADDAFEPSELDMEQRFIDAAVGEPYGSLARSMASVTYRRARADDVITRAVLDVLTERRRQITEEGWHPAQDDEHDNGAMALAAAAYAIRGSKDSHGALQKMAFDVWRWTGWSSQWWKPRGKRHNLVRAAALLIAEIERLDRAESTAENASAAHAGG
ncbi:MAG: hypothetical protein EOO21_02525, partial [Comamonadaceae bacterium]